MLKCASCAQHPHASAELLPKAVFASCVTRNLRRYYENKHVEELKRHPHWRSGHYVDFADGTELAGEAVTRALPC